MTDTETILAAMAYLGRAPQTVIRNVREGCDPIENLVKAAAIIVTAIQVEQSKA